MNDPGCRPGINLGYDRHQLALVHIENGEGCQGFLPPYDRTIFQYNRNLEPLEKNDTQANCLAFLSLMRPPGRWLGLRPALPAVSSPWLGATAFRDRMPARRRLSLAIMTAYRSSWREGFVQEPFRSRTRCTLHLSVTWKIELSWPRV